MSAPSLVSCSDDVTHSEDVAPRYSLVVPARRGDSWLPSSPQLQTVEHEPELSKKCPPAAICRAQWAKMLVGEGRSFLEGGDMPRAVDAFRAALELQSRNFEALQGVSRVQELRGEIESAIEYMTHAVKRGASPRGLVELHYRAGLRAIARGETDSALGYFRAALRWQPSHLASLRKLRALALQWGQWSSAEELLKREAGYSRSKRIRSRTLSDLARLREERLVEPRLAAETWAAARKCLGLEDEISLAAALQELDN